MMVFAAIAEKGSMSAAATQLNLSSLAVSNKSQSLKWIWELVCFTVIPAT